MPRLGRSSLACFSWLLTGCALVGGGPALSADEDTHWIHSFERIQLSAEFYSEGATYGDVNGDGANDLVSGPFWFEGPDFEKRHEFYPPKTFDPKRYSDNFFPYVVDMNGDGRNDILIIGFPGQDASWYENPGNTDAHWKRHLVVDEVSNESPAFVDITGDGKPEIVCIQNGRYGYAEPDWANPAAKFRFVPISEDRKLGRFTHGMGVGDVNGDGRLDLLERGGWYEHPKDGASSALWKHHDWGFTEEAKKAFGLPGGGGAQMYAYDVDGDGDRDVITSRNAHRWGLFWYENQNAAGDGAGPFVPHRITGRPDEPSRYSLHLANMHGIDLVDMDGDGLKDIVTGLRVWAHYGEPSANPPGLLYWFRLARGKNGEVDWVPQLIDDDSGVGVMVKAGDVDGDRLHDVVVGNKKGIYFLKHSRRETTRAEWLRSQPKRFHTSGLKPEDAAAAMSVPEGFAVEVAAAEPQIHQPIAFTLDDRGRLWVAEAHTYPRRAKGHEGKWNEGRDKIVVLEDRDLDGNFETRKVFAQNVNLVSGLEVGFGGVWVGAAPYLLFFADANGDDRADGDPEIVLDGFGFQDTHETLNAFSWGPDGWLYGCHGVFTHSRVGAPGTPDADRVPVNAAYWRFHPQQREFEVFAWGTSNPWGLDFNDYGEAFASACVIPHLYHVIQGARYQRQGGRHFNPHVYDDIKTIADHLHYSGRIQDHAWWGHERPADSEVLARGGGHAHCGLMIYLGDSFPPAHRGRLYMNNIHGNRVNEDRVGPRGSGYVGSHGEDLVIANDAWYRGINLRYGPEGDVYFSDWYDKNACHRTNPEIWDRTTGRLYRLSYLGDRTAPRRGRVQLSRLSSAELVELQLHANDWYVRVARRILQERGPDPDVHAALRTILSENSAVTKKLRALWALHATRGLDPDLATSLLSSDHEYLRAWAIQLTLERKQPPAAFLARLTELAREDTSAVVRRYLASALQRLSLEDREPIAAGLLAREEDREDHNLPLLIWYGVEPIVATRPERALELVEVSQIPLVTRYIVRRLAAEPDHLGVAIDILNRAETTATQLVVLDEILTSLRGQAKLEMPASWGPAFTRLIASESAEIRDRAEAIAVRFGDRRIFPHQRATLADRNADLARRKHALRLLVDGADAECVPVLHSVLAEPDLRGLALKGLAKFGHRETPTAILAVYENLTTTERASAVATLAARPASARALLDAVKDGRVPRTDLSAFIVRQIDSFDDPALRAQLETVWGKVRKTASDKAARIAALKNVLTPKVLESADLSAGRAVFQKACHQCHTLFGDGGKIAPDLTGSNRANLDYILENIVDPNATVGKDYQLIEFVMNDGRVVSGLVASETASALTVQTIDDVVVLPRDELAERNVSPSSLMPDSLLDALKPEEVRDLIAYLGTPVQVLVAGTPVRIDPKTHRVAGAIEAESLASESTSGDVGPQDMRGFGAGKWSGNAHLWWRQGTPGNKLRIKLPVKKSGTYRVDLALTKARDYGVFKLSLDGQPLGSPIDLYDPNVVPTGTILFGESALEAGEHLLEVETVGANPKAIKAYMFGLDYVLLVPVAR